MWWACATTPTISGRCRCGGRPTTATRWWRAVWGGACRPRCARWPRRRWRRGGTTCTCWWPVTTRRGARWRSTRVARWCRSAMSWLRNPAFGLPREYEPDREPASIGTGNPALGVSSRSIGRRPCARAAHLSRNGTFRASSCLQRRNRRARRQGFVNDSRLFRVRESTPNLGAWFSPAPIQRLRDLSQS